MMLLSKPHLPSQSTHHQVTPEPKVILSLRIESCEHMYASACLSFSQMLHSSLRLGAADFEFLQEIEKLMVSQLVALTFVTPTPELHLPYIANMTHLTSLTLKGRVYDEEGDVECLGSSLTLLQSLAALQTLDLFGFKQPVLSFQHLQSLRKLSLEVCENDVCDLTSGTQITSLALTWYRSLPLRILLPAGSSVQLQRLSISIDFTSDGAYQELQNLQDASQLTYLEFDYADPANFVEGGWPASMPYLETIWLATEHALPQQLVDYTHLRNLDITCYSDRHGRSLPTCFSQLTQLDILRVAARVARGLSEFPVCLLQLTQLSSLDLSGSDYFGVDLPHEIVCFSEIAALTNLGMCGVRLSSTAHQQLTSLKTLLCPGVLHWKSC